VVALALGIYNNDNWGPALPKDVQVCNAKFADVGGCRTLDLGSTQGSFLCVDKPGWTFPGPVTAAFCNGAASSYYDVPFNTPEQVTGLSGLVTVRQGPYTSPGPRLENFQPRRHSH
jgi:hypothetical protein